MEPYQIDINSWDDAEGDLRTMFEQRDRGELASFGRDMLDRSAVGTDSEKTDETKPGAAGASSGGPSGSSPNKKDGGVPGIAPSGAAYPQKSGLDTAAGALVQPMAEGAYESARQLASFGRWLASPVLGPKTQEPLAPMDPAKKAAVFGAPDMPLSVPQELLKGLTQFMLPAGGVGKVAKLATGAQKIGVAGHAAIGAGVNFAGFDPKQPKLVNDTAVPAVLSAMGANPKLKAEIEQFLATDPNDTELLARLKSTLDGELLGMGLAGLLAVPHFVRGLRGLRATLPPGPKKVEITPDGIDVKTPEMMAMDNPRHGNPDVRRVADRLREDAGLPAVRPERLKDIDVEASKKIADNYDAMKHNPSDPEVAAAYRAFSDESYEQFIALQREGYTFEPWSQPGQPYASSAEMRADVFENKHLYFFTGGELAADHPMNRVMPNGMSANECFRCVHDIFGHAMEGNEFGPKGETNAWIAHGSMYSTRALPAMSSETIGQNSWVNFGAHLRDETGAVMPTAAGDKPYAQQKAGALDTTPAAGMAWKGDPSFGQRLEQSQAPNSLESTVTAGGGRFKNTGNGLTYFDDPLTNSTLAGRDADMNPAYVTKHIQESRNAFAKGFASQGTKKLNEGGFTYSPGGNERGESFVKPTSGYAVSVHPERGQKFRGRPTEQQLESFYHTNTDLLLQDKNKHIGAWVENSGPDRTSRMTPGGTEMHEIKVGNTSASFFRLGDDIYVDEIVNLRDPNPTDLLKVIGSIADFARETGSQRVEAMVVNPDLKKIVTRVTGVQPGEHGNLSIPVESLSRFTNETTHMDLSVVTGDRAEAMKLGQQHKQKTIYDFASGETPAVEASWAQPLVQAGDEAGARLKNRLGMLGDTMMGESGVLKNTDIDGQLFKDLGVYGAALIARGVKGTEAWSKAMVAQFGDAVTPHLEKLRKQAENVTARVLRSGWDQAKASSQALKYFRNGQEGIGWYSQTLPELEAIYGPEDARMLIGFLAATSPNTTVKANVTLAQKALEQWKLHGKINRTEMELAIEGAERESEFAVDGAFRGYLGMVIKNLEAVAEGRPMSGLKIQNFQAALLGDPNAVVIDRWMMRALWPDSAFHNGAKLRETQYKYVADWVRQKAADLGVTPVDLQAAIWVGIKKLEGRASDSSEAFDAIIKQRAKEIAAEHPRQMGFDDFSAMIDEMAGAE